MKQADTDGTGGPDQQRLMHDSAAPGNAPGMWQLLEEDVWDDWTEQTPGDVDRRVDYVWEARSTPEAGTCPGAERMCIVTASRHASRRKQFQICNDLGLMLVATLCVIVPGCTFPLFVTTPEMTGSWSGRVCVVEVIDEHNEVHEVVGVEILESHDYEADAPGLSSRDQEVDESVFWGFSNERTPLLVFSDGHLVLADGYPDLGRTLTISGVMKYSGVPRLPHGGRRAIRLSAAARVIDDGETNLLYTDNPELIILIDDDHDDGRGK